MKLFLTVAFVASFLLPDIGVADTTTFKCVYKTYSDEKGVHDDDFKLTFILDNDNSAAYVAGNQGSNPVTVVPSRHGISFIEETFSGNIMTTTITKEGNSVHSRHYVSTGAGLVPSQSYGKCFTS